MQASGFLQKKALQTISHRYHMTQALVLFLHSNSGPRPPEGGYLYWGVVGKIKGRWYVWEPGKNGVLREGTELKDPKQYQK